MTMRCWLSRLTMLNSHNVAFSAITSSPGCLSAATTIGYGSEALLMDEMLARELKVKLG